MQPEPLPLEKALEIPGEELDLPTAVRIAIEILKGAAPALAKHFEQVANVQSTWELVLGGFDPEHIREAAIELARNPDGIPDAGKVAAICREMAEERERFLRLCGRRTQLDIEAEREREEQPLSEERRAELQATLERLTRMAPRRTKERETMIKSKSARELTEAEWKAEKERQLKGLLG